MTAPYFDTTKIPGATVTDLSAGGQPVYIPSSVKEKIVTVSEKPTKLLVETLPVVTTQGTATPEQLGATPEIGRAHV